MKEDDLKKEINDILESDFGFEIYAVLKQSNDKIKRLNIYENNNNKQSNNLKNKIETIIKEHIKENFSKDGIRYTEVNNIANNQNVLYVINLTDKFNPFEFLQIADRKIPNYSLCDLNNTDAILFKYSFQRDDTVKFLWGYQKIYPISLPNKKGGFFQMCFHNDGEGDIFEELNSKILMIAHRVDIIIINNMIITGNIKLLEKYFSFNDFIMSSAQDSIQIIEQLDWIDNRNDILEKYLNRGNKKYAKKLMQINNYPITTMPKNSLLQKLENLARWKDIFKVEEGKIRLQNLKDVDSLIDLLVERYTRSDVSGQEYDTDVKIKADGKSQK